MDTEEHVISPDQITKYLCALVRFGGIFDVDTDRDYQIVGASSDIGNPTVRKGDKDVPIRLYQKRMVMGDWAYLNPFNETAGDSAERRFLWVHLSTVVGHLIATLFNDAVKAVTNGEENTPQCLLQFTNSLGAYVDDKTLANIAKHGINDGNYGTIYYDRKTRTAQFQSIFFDAARMKELTGIRKKDIDGVQDFICGLLASTDPMHEYMVKAVDIGCAEAQARLWLLTKLAMAMNPITRDALSIDLCPDVLEAHGRLIEKYRALTSWYRETNCRSKDDVAISTKAPWEVTTAVGSAISGGAPTPAAQTMTPFQRLLAKANTTPQPQVVQQPAPVMGPQVVQQRPSAWPTPGDVFTNQAPMQPIGPIGGYSNNNSFGTGSLFGGQAMPQQPAIRITLPNHARSANSGLF